MAVLRSEHCGRPERHGSHNGRIAHHLAGPGPHLICNGDPATLEAQLAARRNPPPGPPNPPRRVEWDAPCGPEKIAITPDGKVHTLCACGTACLPGDLYGHLTGNGSATRDALSAAVRG